MVRRAPARRGGDERADDRRHGSRVSAALLLARRRESAARGGGGHRRARGIPRGILVRRTRPREAAQAADGVPAGVGVAGLFQEGAVVTDPELAIERLEERL